MKQGFSAGVLRLLVLLLICACVGLAQRPLTADQYTLVLDHFDGNTTGQPFGSPSYVSGPIGLASAVSLEPGASISYALARNALAGGGTLEFWIKPRAYDVGLLTLSHSYEAPLHSLSLALDLSGKLVLGTRACNSSPIAPRNQGVLRLELQTWSHVAVTWGPSGSKIYINGELDASSTDCFQLDDPNIYFFYYASLNDQGIRGLGSIDELQIASTVRSAAEIADRIIRTPAVYAPTALPSGTVGSNYLVHFTASGGIGSLTWTASGLPTGLAMDVDGAIRGIPQTAGTYSVGVVVRDSRGSTGTRSLPLVINPGPIVTPPPTLTSITPQQTAAGGVDLLLDVVGTDFPSGARIAANGVPLTTTYISATSLRATIPAGQIATPGSVTITVVTVSGGTTNARILEVRGSPVLTGISPRQVSAGAGDFDLELSGSAFVNASRVHANGQALATIYIAPGSLRARIPGALLTAPGPLTITVVNPGGATSTSQAFTVQAVQTTVECSYTVSPGNASAPLGGQTGSFTVSAPAGCSWTPVAEAPWITVANPGPQSGTGVVNYSVAASANSTRRAGAIAIRHAARNETFSIVQPVTLTCQILPFVPPTIRSAGLAELVNDLVIGCLDTSTSPQVSDIRVTLNTNITSKILNGSTEDSEATLLVNEPSTITLGSNAFRGRLSGSNSLVFAGVPLGGSTYTTLRITNLRVNAAMLAANAGESAGVFATIALSNSGVPLTVRTSQMAFVLTSLSFAVGPAGAGPVQGASVIPVVFTETQAAAFRVKGPGLGQTESGFMNAALGADAGAATTATRLLVRLAAIPAGVRVYAPAGIGSGATANLISANASGVGGTPVTGTSMFGGSYQQLAASNGVATAVWEISAANTLILESLVAALVVENASSAQIEQIRATVNAALAPLSSDPNAVTGAAYPRFADLVQSPKLVNLRISASIPQAVSLTAAKTTTRDSVGGNVTFLYKVLNDSASSAQDVIIRGNVPPGFEIVNCAIAQGSCEGAGNSVRGSAASIPAGDSRTIEVRTRQTRDLASGTLAESYMSVSSDEVDTELSSNEASSQLIVQNCSEPLQPAQATFAAPGGSGQITFPACELWVAAASASWVRITAGAAGSGAGFVSYNVEPNARVEPRTAEIQIGARRFSITQSGVPLCTLSATPVSLSAPAEGLRASLTLTTNSTLCNWAVTVDQPWLQVSPPLSGVGNATLIVTAFPNFAPRVRKASVSFGAVSVEITQAADTGSLNERFVRRAFFSALRRVPTPGYVADTVAVIENGSSWTEVMFRLLDSPEFQAGGKFVSALYRVLLGRVPEKGGWDFQLNAILVDGIPQPSLTLNFLSSPEWMLRQGNVTDLQFVRLLFQEVLGRNPSDAESAFQLEQARISGRGQLATNFLGVPEFYLRKGALLDAVHVHYVVLGRSATSQEIAAREAQLTAGLPLRSLISDLLNSPEFLGGLQ